MASNERARRRHPERHGGDKGPVVFATLFPSQTSSLFAESAQNIMMRDGERPERDRMFIREGGGSLWMMSGPRIAEARTQIVRQFLTEDRFEGAEWLLMVDSDMIFRYDDVRCLYEAADRTSVPVIGGLCFAGMLGSQIHPTLYRLERGDKGVTIKRIFDYPQVRLSKVDATGAAFLLVHRDVFEKMSRAHPYGFATMPNGAINPYPWFAEGHVDAEGRPMGEDITFCMRANAIDIPIHVHTGAQIGHHKSVVLDEDLYRSTRQRDTLVSAPP